MQVTRIRPKPGMTIDDVLEAFVSIGLPMNYIGTFGKDADQGNMLIHYARDPETKQPYGTVVAKQVGGMVQIGWSLWADTNEYQFKKEFQRKIAEGRATKGTTATIPHELDDAIEYMCQRAMKYYRVGQHRVAVAGVY